jgi:HEAT repeat protein
MSRKSLRALVLDVALLMVGGLLCEAAAGASLDAQLQALRAADARSRADAARALGALGDSRAILPLLATTADIDSDVRKAAADALAALGEPLGEVIRQSLEGSVEARRELARRRDARSIDPLLLALRQVQVRAAATEALVAMGAVSAPALRKALTSSDEGVRALAAGALAEVGGPHEVDPLIEVLRDRSADARAQSARALGAIGDRRAVPGLLAATGDRFDEVRKAAAAALALLGEPLGEVIRQSLEGSLEARRELTATRDPRAVEPLVRALDTPDAATQAAAVASLGELAAVGVEGALASLEDAVDNPHGAVRASAIAGLSRQRNAGSGVERFVAALSDSDPGVRQSAARALGEIGDRRVVDRLMERLGDAHPDVRAAIAAALAALGEPSGELVLQVLADSATARAELARRADPRAVAALLRLGAEGSPAERLAVAKTLEVATWPAAVPALIARLERDRDVEVRVIAARALGAKQDDRAIEPLLLELIDVSSELRSAAAESLEQLGEPLGRLIVQALDGSQRAREELAARSPDQRITSVLINALGAADFAVRIQAAWTLWFVPDARAVLPLLDTLKYSNPELRLGVVGALGAIGDRAAVGALCRALLSDPRVQRAAAWGLGRIGAEEAVPALLEALNNVDADTRELVVVALGVVGNEEARAGLRRALGDPDPHVRAAAQQALSDLSRHDAGRPRSQPRE